MNPIQDQNTNQPIADPAVVDAGMSPTPTPVQPQADVPVVDAAPAVTPSMSDGTALDAPLAGATVVPTESPVANDMPIVADDSSSVPASEAAPTTQESATPPPDDQPAEPEAPQTGGSF